MNGNRGQVIRTAAATDYALDLVVGVSLRKPLTPKQQTLFVVVIFCLNTPAAIFVFCYSSGFSPRQVAAVGALNLLLGVPLLALIAEKWIRKL